jgi:type II secretory pathway component GspD/PulD (secretin)
VIVAAVTALFPESRCTRAIEGVPSIAEVAVDASEGIQRGKLGEDNPNLDVATSTAHSSHWGDTPMSQRLLVCALLALATLSAAAQDTPPVAPKRGAYVVKCASAKDLAGILGRQFKGAADIQAGPEGTSNCLLINAPPAVFDEIMKTLAQLDRQPHAIAVEVFLVELPAKKAEDKGKGLDEKDLDGTLDEVAERLNGLMKRGQVVGVKRMQLATLEGQVSSLLLGESRPIVTGTNVTATGTITRRISFHNVGTQIKVTPQVAADGSLTLDLDVKDSRGRDSTTATVGTDEKGKPIPATEFLQTTLTSKISVPPGKAVLAKDAKVVSKEGEGETLILVGARVLESAPKAR